LRDLSWEGASLLDGDLVEAVEELKRQPGDELQVHGSIELCRALLAAGLVDRHRLLVLPVALGSGARLFDDTVPPTKFRLEEARDRGRGAAAHLCPRRGGRPGAFLRPRGGLASAGPDRPGVGNSVAKRRPSA
jgi:dihydrofolate reductase